MVILNDSNVNNNEDKESTYQVRVRHARKQSISDERSLNDNNSECERHKLRGDVEPTVLCTRKDDTVISQTLPAYIVERAVDILKERSVLYKTPMKQQQVPASVMLENVTPTGAKSKSTEIWLYVLYVTFAGRLSMSKLVFLRNTSVSSDSVKNEASLDLHISSKNVSVFLQCCHVNFQVYWMTYKTFPSVCSVSSENTVSFLHRHLTRFELIM